MKKICLTLIAIAFAVNFSYAQWTTSGTVTSTSNTVGIGTTSPESGWLLDVNGLGTIGSQGSARIYMGTIDATHSFIQSRDNSVNQNLLFYASSYSFSTGKFGIGTTSPGYTLDVAFNTNGNDGIRVTNTNSGTTAQVQNRVINDAGSIGYTGISSSGYTSYIPLNGGQAFFGSYNVPVSIFTQSASPIVFYPNSVESMRITPAGNVGIGTTTPDQLLSVAGNIHAQEVLVNLTGFEDRVFKKTYHLPTLPELKTYIDKNHHLPDVPSEAEVVKNGLKLGDMDRTLTKKVEELTLYLIEKDKQISQQQATNQTLQQEIDELKKQVSNLTKPKS
jgi:hypothetical protein